MNRGSNRNYKNTGRWSNNNRNYRANFKKKGPTNRRKLGNKKQNNNFYMGRIIRTRLPKRSSGSNILWHHYNYRTKKSGIGKVALKNTPSLYLYNKSVPTIYPEIETIGGVYQLFEENFNSKKDFITDEVEFTYQPDQLIKTLPKLNKENKYYQSPNEYDFIATTYLDQLIISPKYRLAYTAIVDEIPPPDIKLTIEQTNEIIDNITKDYKVDISKYMTKEQIEFREKIILDKIYILADNLDKNLVKDLTTIVDLRNKYDIMDNLDQLEMKNYFDSDGVIKTNYLIKSNYWKNFEQNLGNYDPVELLYVLSLLKKGNLVLEMNVPDNGKQSITINELFLFSSNVLKIDIGKPNMVHLVITGIYRNQPLYTIVF
jgi:hypothetical protein